MRTKLTWLMAGMPLLVACAAQPPAPQEPPPLDDAAFNARITKLESTLLEQCDTQALESRQTSQYETLRSNMHEVGNLLRVLQKDVATIEARGGEPLIVREECEAQPVHNAKTVLGRSEWVGFPAIGTYLKARIDSGASTSSLSASDITRFERDGEDWVRFKLALNDEDVAVERVKDEWIEAPIQRRVRIVQASGEESRPVISLLMTLGPIRENVEFTLNDRTHLDFPVLLGRRFMMDIATIDVAQTYVHDRPEFPGGEPADQAADDEVSEDQDDTEE
ncbi:MULTISPECIES: ATP-dependent zinc protease [unclassified Halomonas]|uniref:ATP-dependent zinc protease family protein n=1 Tax=unclassified Halomonas TaxID=2609666 RepID=UPI0021E4CB9F|nr:MULTISPECIES: ATP-dependent zinc protease [unclassified Halomonas]UYF98374.1 ATP-dependent zinc protease [Halomonas sp. GD1P12]WNL40503.1 ATP-dependent zinc protease [Halomonas sp. PAMB 3232]